jgi:hypothetical protein
MSQNNLFSAVTPLYYTSKFFGLAPTGWRKENNEGLCVAGRGIASYLWTFVWIIGLCALLYIKVCFVLSLGFDTKYTFGVFIYQTPLYTASIASLSVGALINRSKISDLLYKISVVDNVLMKRKYALRMYRHMSLTVSTVLVLAMVTVCGLSVSDAYSFGDLNYEWMLGIIPFHVNIVSLVNFYIFVLILRYKYKILNDQLVSSSVSMTRGHGTDEPFRHSGVTRMSVVATNTRKVKTFPFALKMNVAPSSETLVPISQTARRQIAEDTGSNVPRRGAFYSRPMPKRSTLPELSVQDFRSLYDQLYDVSSLINYIYGFPILSVILWLVTATVSNTTFLLHEGISATTAPSILLDLLYLMLLLLIMFFCHVTTDEARRSSVVVQKLLLLETLDQVTTCYLDRLFVQLEGMRVAFTSCGLFRLDMPRFCGILGVICTYVVILTQIK